MTAVTYEKPVKQFEGHNTPCCGNDVSAVYYNPDNKCVQCHSCGHVWEPLKLVNFEDVFGERDEIPESQSNSV